MFILILLLDFVYGVFMMLIDVFMMSYDVDETSSLNAIYFKHNLSEMVLLNYASYSEFSFSSLSSYSKSKIDSKLSILTDQNLYRRMKSKPH